jgi:hypothetical protein
VLRRVGGQLAFRTFPVFDTPLRVLSMLRFDACRRRLTRPSSEVRGTPMGALPLRHPKTEASPMLENITAPGYETINRADEVACRDVTALLDRGLVAPVIAEIGVGVGATTQQLARILDNRGALHLYDFEDELEELVSDLEALDYRNVVGFGNTTKHWDSYNWSLLRQIERTDGPIYDYIYLDGSHIFMHDGLAFFLCDRLLKVGGCINFDDYYWSVSRSKWMGEQRHEFMTDEQIDTQNIKLLVDLLVVTNPRYEEVVPQKVFRKIA